jgi:signal transduction histidine kinase
MKFPPLPTNEKERLEALYAYDILDTPAEKEYDDIARLASIICQTPITLITLIDKDRQWFKARVGVENTETPRDYAFCSHAILQNTLMQVPNALQDDRFHDNPYVSNGMQVRFYAGMPLTTSEGYNLGTLCVIDKVPRQLTEEQQFALQVLAKQVTEKIEMRLKNKKLDFQKELLQKQLDFQKRVFSLIAHDVRSPLISMHGIVHLFTDELISFEEAKSSALKIQKDIQNILNILDHILAWGKLQQSNNKINPRVETFNLKEYLLPIFESETHRAEQKGVKFSYSIQNTSSNIQSDPFLLGSIIRNLLNNAIKFTPAGGKVFCEISQESQNLKIIVKDTGIGMSEEIQQNFWTGAGIVSRKGTNNEQGSGTALQLLRTFIYLLGGKIYLESKENEGTTFTVFLPLNEKF